MNYSPEPHHLSWLHKGSSELKEMSNILRWLRSNLLWNISDANFLSENNLLNTQKDKDHAAK